MTIKNTREPFFLALDAAEHLYSCLEWILLKPKKILIVGESREQGADLLRKKFPNAELIIEKDSGELANQSIELIFANLVLPWKSDLQAQLREWRRVLKAGGLLLFSSFGPDTLKEYRAQLGNATLINLIDMHNVGDELIHAGFTDPVLDVDYLTVQYRDFSVMLGELQTGRIILPNTSIPAQAEMNNYPITFEMVYGHAWVARDKFFADEDGVVKIPLSQVKRGQV